MGTIKGFIQDYDGNNLLPITRAELVLDKQGEMALTSTLFLAGNLNGLPGLVTAAERAIITNLLEGTDIINNGLLINDLLLNFYDQNGNATPINFKSTDRVILSREKNNKLEYTNNVFIDLNTIHTNQLTATTFIKGITVDKYGRVLTLSSSALADDDIPTELTNKNLSGCTTANLAQNASSNSLVNKKYVDDAIGNINITATGALKFIGGVNDADTINSILANDDNLNNFYKVTGYVTLDTNILDNKNHLNNPNADTFSVNAGDTLIVTQDAKGNLKYTHIPSADEITYVSVTTKNDTVAPYDAHVGNIILKFDERFTVVELGDVASITMKHAKDSEVGGYITQADYETFSQYAAKSVTYEATVTDKTANAYKIGDLQFDGLTETIYGIKGISDVSLSSDSTNSTNPILTFTKDENDEVAITYQGGNGIQVIKTDDNTITFQSDILIGTDSKHYLTSDGSTIDVRLGDVLYPLGLATVEKVAELVGVSNCFDEIDYSLLDEETWESIQNQEFRYGNIYLRKAIGGDKLDTDPEQEKWDKLNI